MTQEKRKDWLKNLPKVPYGVPQINLPSSKYLDSCDRTYEGHKDQMSSAVSKNDLNSTNTKISMRSFLQKQRKPFIDPRERVGPAHPAYLENKFSAKAKYGENKRTNSTRQLIPHTVVIQKDTSQQSRAGSPRVRKASHSRSELKSENNTRIILRSLDKYTQLPSSSTKTRAEGKSLRELKPTPVVHFKPLRIEKVLPVRGPHPSAMEWFKSQTEKAPSGLGSVTPATSVRSVEANPKPAFHVSKRLKGDSMPSQREYLMSHNSRPQHKKEESSLTAAQKTAIIDSQSGLQPPHLHRRRRASPATSSGQLPSGTGQLEVQSSRIKEISEMIRLQHLPDFPHTSLNQTDKPSEPQEGLFFNKAETINSAVSSSVEFGWKLKQKHRKSYHVGRIHNFLDRATLDIKVKPSDIVTTPQQQQIGHDTNKLLEQEIMNDFKKMMKRGFLH